MSNTEALLGEPAGRHGRQWSPVVWATMNMVATTVGTGVLAIPISFSFMGLAPGLVVLLGFAALSDASLRFIVAASARTGATSYADLGERCFGPTGGAVVLWSLVALLVGAFIQVHICITDLIEMLLSLLLDEGDARFAPRRLVVSALITCLVIPPCLMHDLSSLRFLSTASVLAILFTVGCVFSLSLSSASEPGWVAVAPLSMRWTLAMPIHLISFCSQFQINELSQQLPAKQRARISTVIHVSMGAAYAIYALVGTTGYVLLGSHTSRYPNVLTAFGSDRLVAAGSAAIALVNFLKIPLVLLPLRSLLLSQLGLPPLKGPPHAVLTVAMVVVLGGAAAWAHDLALAFEVAGCTAGTVVCFVLPGALLYGSRRCAGTSAALADPRAARRDMIKGLAMAGFGAASGLVCLVALIFPGLGVPQTPQPWYPTHEGEGAWYRDQR